MQLPGSDSCIQKCRSPVLRDIGYWRFKVRKETVTTGFLGGSNSGLTMRSGYTRSFKRCKNVSNAGGTHG